MSIVSDIIIRLQFLLGPRVQVEVVISLCIAFAAWFLLPRIKPLFEWIAEQPFLPFLISALLPVVLCVIGLFWRPIPYPMFHDEFNHLLVADTLAHGRLANPTHPFWRHFESTYVLQNPAYASSYPLGNGAALALGILLTGIPWAGVLLSAALFCAAMLWMLRAWFAPSWAFLGSILTGLIYCVSTPFVLEYWGGLVAGAAGTLLLGAMARGKPCVGIGAWSVIFLTRPYEACCLAPVVATVFLYRRYSIPKLALCLLPVLAVSGLHNFRITGSALTLPYQLSRQQYGVPQSFLFQPPVPRPPLTLKALIDGYDSQLFSRMNLAENWLRTNTSKFFRFIGFFIDYYFLAPCLMIPWVRIKHKAWLLGFCASLLLGNSLYPFYFNQYAAPLTGAIMIFALSGCMKLYSTRWGRFVVVFLLTCACFRTVRNFMQDRYQPAYAYIGPSRSGIDRQLRSTSGQHLVFVRYGSEHVYHWEWIYNDADIDNARIVWAHPLGANEDAALVKYYSRRRVWTVEPDNESIRLVEIGQR